MWPFMFVVSSVVWRRLHGPATVILTSHAVPIGTVRKQGSKIFQRLSGISQNQWVERTSILAAVQMHGVHTE